MRIRTQCMAVTVLAVLASSPIFAADAMKDKEATPSLGERITKDAVTGTLMKIEGGEYFSIKDNDGKLVKVHVDKSTKLDRVMEGDKVKAYITNQGHATTLQRLEK